MTKKSVTSTKKQGRRTVLTVGAASFFGGISQDIFVPVLPLYLSQTLGLDKAAIGLIEGSVTAAASGFKIIAGYVSDKLHLQKPLVLAGYGLSMAGRMVLAFVHAPLAVFGLRLLDGIGKGVKDPPKDVLVANAAHHTDRGWNFGLARMLDTLGSAVGPLILSGLLVIFERHHVPEEHSYRILMVVAASVLVVTLAVVQLGIHEQRRKTAKKAAEGARLNHGFYLFVAISGVFALANSSDAFLILRSQDIGLSVVAIPLVYAVLNVVYGLLALPAGMLSDKVGRLPVIAGGWVVYGLCYLGFAVADSAWQLWPLFAFYGLFYAASEGVGRAFIADLVGAGARGRAYGIYNTIIGLAALPAGAIAGLLWERISPSAPFYVSAAVALAAVLLLLGCKRWLRPGVRRFA